MSFGIGIGDIITISTLAWETFTALKSAPEEFEGIKMEVLSLSMTLQTLSEEAQTPYSILRRATPQKKENLRVLLQNTTNGLSELRSLVGKCSSLDKPERRHFFERVDFARKGKQALRDRLAIHTASLNMLLTSLTHGSLGRMEQLIASSSSSSSASTNGTLHGSTLAAVERDLESEGLSSVQLSPFQDEIRDYVRHLASGGRPIQWHQFQQPESAVPSVAATRVESPRHNKASFYQAVPYSMVMDSDEIVIDVRDYMQPQEDPVEDLVTTFDSIFSVDEGFAPQASAITTGPLPPIATEPREPMPVGVYQSPIATNTFPPTHIVEGLSDWQQSGTISPPGQRFGQCANVGMRRPQP
ncbi:hypothetical protein MBLNU459_g0754t1 [Dothideomycetes sp. NU459]